MTDQPEIYLASVALEPNRWKGPDKRRPSFAVSAWSDKAREAGFDGWELWEFHFHLADDGEKEALSGIQPPVRIFNTYQLPGYDTFASWQDVVRAVEVLGAPVHGIKFNLGKGEVPVETQVEEALRWGDALPDGVRMLCECHPGTVLETPEAAARAFGLWPRERFSAIMHPMRDDPDHIPDWFDALGDRITHLHWQARGDNKKVCPLGEKRELLEVVGNSLQKAGFRGTHSVEFVHGLGQPWEGVETLFASAVEDLRVLRAIQAG